MGIHDKAWDGVTHLIFADKDLLPMQIEQSLAMASPANEVGFESYEDYGDALDYCKERKDVGFVILSDTNKSLPVLDIFRNFSKAYEEASGLPLYGVLFYEDQPNVEGYRYLVEEPKLLDYIDVKKLTDKHEAYHFLTNIWDKYIEQFEQFLIPSPLKKTYLSVAANEGFGPEEDQFCNRLSHLLSADLNVSWLDMQAIRWIHVCNVLTNKQPAVINANPLLTQISKIASYNADQATDLESTIKADLPLPGRISGTVAFLNQARTQGNMEEVLDQVISTAKPRSPALIKHLKRKKRSIIDLAHDIQNNHTLKRAQ